jgi:hypothetical protein
MPVDVELRRRHPALPEEVGPGRFSVFVDRRLGRKARGALAVAAIVDQEHRVSELAKRFDLGHAGRHIAVVAVKVQHDLGT